jgi:hypothetical protein
VSIRAELVRLVGWLLAILPGLWLLTHPVPLSWLVPFAREPRAPVYVPSSFWPLILWCAVPSLLALRSWKWRQAVTFGWVAILFCGWQAYCYNSATHPARNPFVLWGLLPATDSHFYLNSAVEIAEGIGIRTGLGARQMWPGFLALLHTWCNGDLKLMLALLVLMQAAITVAAWEMVCKLLGRCAAFVWLCSVVFFLSHLRHRCVHDRAIGLATWDVGSSPPIVRLEETLAHPLAIWSFIPYFRA